MRYMKQTTDDKICTACAITIIVSVVGLVAFVVFGGCIKPSTYDVNEKLRLERIELYLNKTKG